MQAAWLVAFLAVFNEHPIPLIHQKKIWVLAWFMNSILHPKNSLNV